MANTRTIRWRFEHAVDAFGDYRDRWDKLNAAQGDHVLLDTDFVEPLIRHFAPRDVLLAIADDEPPVGLGLVVKTGTGFWQTFQPSQAPLGLVVLQGDCDAEAAVRGLMRSLPGHCLGLAILCQDPDATRFVHSGTAPQIEVLDYITTARLPVAGTFDDYWRARSRNLTHNLARQRRRLAERGGLLELVIERRAEDVAHAIAEYGRLEGSSWKAAAGTAITADTVQGRFYTDVLERFCRRGDGVIFRLLMDGRTIASTLCVERGGTLVMLKTAYDKDVEGSPGLLIQQDLLSQVFSAGRTQVIEYYGRVMDWHTKFTTDVRQMFHVNYYRHPWVSRGRQHLKAAVSALRGAMPAGAGARA
jgi:hypothetical protein